MDAVVFTKSRQEYGMLSGILADESPGMRVSQGSMDGHYHLEHKYDIVVVGVDGAQGMELVCAYRERFGDALVIWITDDPYFAGWRYGRTFLTLSSARLRNPGSGRR